MIIFRVKQGTLTEVEGSVKLASSLRSLVYKEPLIFALSKSVDLNESVQGGSPLVRVPWVDLTIFSLL
jgi:hypothetical protein